MVLSYDPRRVFLPVGFALLAIGIAKLVYDWTTRDFILAAKTLLILFASFQTITIGLLADLVVRMSRPATQVSAA